MGNMLGVRKSESLEENFLEKMSTEL